MKWGLWSVTAGSNSATPPDGWPEGQAPSTVNDCAREMMAQIRTGLNNLQFIDLGVTPTETGNTTFTLAGNQMQWYPFGNRVAANVGGTIYTGSVISSSYTTNTGVTLRFDMPGAVLTNSLSAVATGYPSAVNGSIPDTVYKRMNPIINGSMDIWQRGAGPFGVSGGAINTYAADRWALFGSTTAGCSINISRFERSANVSFVPTLTQAGVFLTCAYGLSVSAALSTVNNGTYLAIVQRIEGYTYRQFAQHPMSIQFWVNSRQTGTYCLALQNAGADHSIVLQYSISSVATWEKKTLQIPRPPASGTWDYSTGIGLQVAFTLVCGSSNQGGAGNWTAAGILGTSAQTNFCVSAGNVFMLTGVQLEEGNQCTPLQPVDYPTELNRCLRYHQALLGGSTAFNLQGNATAANNGIFVVNALQTMRANISATWPTPVTNTFAYNIGASGVSVSAVAVESVTPYNVTFQLTQQGTGNMTTGQGCFASWQGLYIQLDAEL